MKLYAMPRSGNCYKVAWMLTLLREPFEVKPINILKAETHTQAFLKKNPNAKVPVLELDDGTCLSESNAILLHFAEGTPYLPKASTLERAKIYEWLFFEQYSHEPCIAVRRANRIFGRPCGGDRDQQLLEGGHKAFLVMESRLNQNEFLVGEAMTVADMALFAYTHTAEEEGGYDMSSYPGIQKWLIRMKQAEGFVEMDSLLDRSFLQDE